MTEDQKNFCIDVAVMYFREGFSDWMNGADTPKDHQGRSYYTGFKEAKNMNPNR